MTTPTLANSLNQQLFVCAIDGALVVPTRSLANVLAEEFAADQLKQGHTAWVRPSILTWTDLLHMLWRYNKPHHAELAELTPINAAQSLVLWTRILDAAKRSEDHLRLLNVAQTAKAAQSAYSALFEWQLTREQIFNANNIDMVQYLQWQDSYDQLCQTEGFLDPARVPHILMECEAIQCPYQKLVFYAFDLFSDAQQDLIDHLARAQVLIGHRATGYTSKVSDEWLASRAVAGDVINHPTTVNAYVHDAHELQEVLKFARTTIERDPDQKVGIVVPDLQSRRAQIARLAREVFYPNLTPLEAEQQASAYRISLGRPLLDWSAVRVGLLLLSLLKPRVSSRDFASVLRSQSVFVLAHKSGVVDAWLNWLAGKRIHTLEWTQITDTLEQFKHAVSNNKVVFAGQLEQRNKQASAFCSALNTLFETRVKLLAAVPQSGGRPSQSPQQWVALFESWLQAWSWSTGEVGAELGSEQFQLRQKFDSTLQSFADLKLVLSKCGVGRALDLLTTLCQDTVFAPQAEPTPILISGVYEAIGREVDLLLLTGLSEEFLASLPSIPFIPASALVNSSYPSANYERHFEQSLVVLKSLLLSAKTSQLSFAKRELTASEQPRSVSPLIRKLTVVEIPLAQPQSENVGLLDYVDNTGLPYPTGAPIDHGMRIFKEQSSCAFRAFASHRLACQHVDDAEFGLEPSAQGVFIHAILEEAWGDLAGSQSLEAWLLKTHEQQSLDIDRWIEAALEECTKEFTAEQMGLLTRERDRYHPLLRDWLAYESTRPVGFSVVEREWWIESELNGIPYRGIIDRVDLTDDGRVVIIDYKSGNVSRDDWTGERLSNPQMPLYMLAHEQKKQRAASGVAYAIIRRGDLKFDYLAEQGILPGGKSLVEERAESWAEFQPHWKTKLETLAVEFLQGDARVNPVDDKACKYCPYDGLCRVRQINAAQIDAEFDTEFADD